MRTRYDKLIRDRIPAIMDEDHVRYEVETMDDAAYRAALRTKLIEEAQEAAATGARADLIKELADLREVARSLASAEGIGDDEIEAERAARERARGGFRERLRLLWTERASPDGEAADRDSG